ncbi:MAG: DUF1858 domain-containing protein [Dehalococcoidia bacterium]|jgi:hypothetical protein|nr:MAG: DUF1858 domain-containing protein [Dehalococcoidia bacterium]
MKEIDLTRSVYELTGVYPELIGILKELGFAGVANPVVRNTIGRTMTIPQGCQKQGKNLDEVIVVLEGEGFRVKTP